MVPVKRLRGMHDLSQDSWLRKRDLQDRLVELFGGYGYRILDMPVLESTELFLRKSGGELASRMYSFTDPGNSAVSLRPEFTSPIMRYYLEHAREIELPARWQYAGPVFRYDASRPEASGQFTQVGAELLGSASVMADAELLELASRVPGHLGINDYVVEVADLDVLQSVLDTVGLSERARSFVMSCVAELRRGRSGISPLLERAERLHIVGHGADSDYLSAAVDGLDDSQARGVLQGILQWTGGDSSRLGQRDPQEVVDRLLRKLRGSDESGKLEQALALVADLAEIRDEPEAALDAARKVVRRAQADPSALDRLGELLELLPPEARGGGRLLVDFALARGLAYYNGIIFEVKHGASEVSLGGGGRYDGLARALGSADAVPASGFAYSLEAFLSLDEPGKDTGEGNIYRPGVLVLPEDSGSCFTALSAASELRREGVTAELGVCGWDLSEGVAYARKKSFSRVVVAHADGMQTIHVIGS